MNEELLAELGLEKRVEYRALIRTPASFLATPKERNQGYVERWSDPYPSKSLVELRRWDPDLRRSEETWATFIRWEERIVLVGPWKESE